MVSPNAETLVSVNVQTKEKPQVVNIGANLTGELKIK